MEQTNIVRGLRSACCAQQLGKLHGNTRDAIEPVIGRDKWGAPKAIYSNMDDFKSGKLLRVAVDFPES